MSLDRSLCVHIRSSVRTRVRMHLHLHACVRMHLDPREFACVYTHKCKLSFLRVFVCSRVGLIKMQNAFACKNRKTQTHVGFKNFPDVLYVYLTLQSLNLLCMSSSTLSLLLFTLLNLAISNIKFSMY